MHIPSAVASDVSGAVNPESGSLRTCVKEEAAFVFLPPLDDPRRGVGSLPLEKLRHALQRHGDAKVLLHEDLFGRLEACDAPLASRVLELRKAYRSLCVIAARHGERREFRAELLLLAPVFSVADFIGISETSQSFELASASRRRNNAFDAALDVACALRRLESDAKIVFLFVGVRASLSAPQPSRQSHLESDVDLCINSSASSFTTGSLLEQLDSCVCKLLLDYNADCLDTAGEEAAALALLRLSRVAVASQKRSFRFASGNVCYANSIEMRRPKRLVKAATDLPRVGGGSEDELLSRVWQTQLLQLPGVSTEVARAVASVFRSPAELCTLARQEEREADTCRSEGESLAGLAGRSSETTASSSISTSTVFRRSKKCDANPSALLREVANVKVSGKRGSRKVGAALAKRILETFTFSRDPEAFL